MTLVNLAKRKVIEKKDVFKTAPHGGYSSCGNFFLVEPSSIEAVQVKSDDSKTKQTAYWRVGLPDLTPNGPANRRSIKVFANTNGALTEFGMVAYPVTLLPNQKAPDHIKVVPVPGVTKPTKKDLESLGWVIAISIME